MKKILVIATLLLATLAFIGCCTSPNNSNKNIGNCLSKVAGPVEAVLCPPNKTQMDQAAAAAAWMTKTFLGKDYTTAIAMAEQIFLAVANGICVGLDQLNITLTTYDQAVQLAAPLVVQGQVIRQMATAAEPAPDVSALRKVLKK